MTWTKARFTSQAKPYCWRLWKADVDVNAKMSEIIVRAIDSTGNVQPETVAWNLKGDMFNAWHKTPLHVGQSPCSVLLRFERDPHRGVHAGAQVAGGVGQIDLGAERSGGGIEYPGGACDLAFDFLAA